MEWISVKDRLPEFDELVLCHCRIYGRFVGFYKQIEDTAWGGSGLESQQAYSHLHTGCHYHNGLKIHNPNPIRIGIVETL